MHRFASTWVIVLGTASALVLVAPAGAGPVCKITPIGYICEDSGIIPGTPPGDPPGEPPLPLRYLRTATDPGIGLCWLWARTPPGLDSWDPANDAAIINTRRILPRCPGSAVDPAPVGSGVPDYAWSVFRSFPLAAPVVALEPPGAGITGLPTFASVAPVDPVVFSETLPPGTVLEVQGAVASVLVDWGDGSQSVHGLAELQPYPAGTATHAYRTRTCTPEQRAVRPGGASCHPSLGAYPVTVTFVWSGRYRYGGDWVDLGTLDRSTTTAYDVDEVVAVLEP